MTKYYVTPNPNGTAGMLRVEGEHTPKPTWIEIDEEQYRAFSASFRGLRVVDGVPELVPEE